MSYNTAQTSQPYWGQEYNVYKPQTQNGQYLAGEGLNGAFDTRGAYNWSLGQGAVDQGTGYRMLTGYNGQQDTARWSYANNASENSWDHWTRLRNSLVQQGWGVQQAGDEALKEMAAVFKAQGGNWGATGFGAVPGITDSSAAGGSGTGAPPTDGSAGGGGTGMPATGAADVNLAGGAGGNNAANGSAASGTGTAGSGTGNLSGTLGAFYMQRPENAVYDYEKSIGINPAVHSFMGDWAGQLMNSIAPALFQNNYGADGKLAVDQLQNPGNLLGAIFANGQGLGGNLRNFANTAWAKVTGNPNLMNRPPAEMQRMLSDLNALSTFGQNPYLAAANQDALKQAIARYQSGQTAALRSGNNAALNQTLGSYIAGAGGLVPTVAAAQ